MQTIKFKPGLTYWMRSLCDHNCIWEVTIISRTEKTVKANVEGETKSFRIKMWDNIEIIKPLGSYSMCPVLKATNLKNEIGMISLVKTIIDQFQMWKFYKLQGEDRYFYKYYEFNNYDKKWKYITQNGIYGDILTKEFIEQDWDIVL